MMPAMQTNGIAPGDIVRLSVRGRVFHALVRGVDAGGLTVDPVEKGVSCRRAGAGDVLEHWASVGRPRAQALRAVSPEQRSLDDLLDR